MRSTLSLTCVLLAFACAGGSVPPAGLSAEDVAAIKRTERNWVQAMLAGDWSAGAAIHTLDAVRMPPIAPDVRGRAAILTALPQYGKPTAFTERMSAERVENARSSAATVSSLSALRFSGRSTPTISTGPSRSIRSGLLSSAITFPPG